MNKKLYQPKLKSEYAVPSSKSVLHRLLILQAFSERKVKITYNEPVGEDIKATIECINALKDESKIRPVLDCKDSGSTYRFLFGVIKKLEIECELTGTKKLLERVNSGAPTSQFLTGDLMGAYLKGEDYTQIDIPDNQVSKSYIELTKEIIKKFDNSDIIHAEGDWSLGAFWLTAGAITGEKVKVKNLDYESSQGDRKILEYIDIFRRSNDRIIDGSTNPDLVPVLAVLAAFSKGTTRIENIEHLRYKESDRVETTTELINNLGGKASSGSDYIEIEDIKLKGGTVDAKNDHRIAMSAAISSFATPEPVNIVGIEAVNKSYPNFWEEF